MALRKSLTLSDLLERAGYSVEGPGTKSDGDLAGRYWWTLTRNGWSGIECGPDFASAAQARESAVADLLADDDLDWRGRSVRPHAIDQFPLGFNELMKAARYMDSAAR